MVPSALMTYNHHTGDVLLSNLAIGGDASIKDVEGSVTLSDSNLSLEDISIIQVTENVTVEDNTDLNLTVEEVEGAVTISGNMIDIASMNKNIGGIDITGSTITTLSCSDNTPAPNGSGNTVGAPDG